MKVPYQMVAAMSYQDRHAQMFHALQLGLPRLQQVPIDDSKTLSIACYGPSLRDTWQNLQRPILSMSGATHFLAERGVIPDYHCDMDPRAHKIKHLDPPVDGVHYLMASVCPPETWTILKNQRVTLWHTYSGKNEKGETTYDWVGRHDPNAVVIHGGSTIGLTALHLGGVMGYRHFEVHGMDGSYADASRAERHAGVHYGHAQQDGITWNAEGVTYQTSKIMANAVQETLNTMKAFPMFCVFHGRGLTQALVRELNVANACTADQIEKAKTVRTATCTIYDSSRLNQSIWESMLNKIEPEWLVEIQQSFAENETRRQLARYNTGAVPFETALLLRALSAAYRPKVIVEVGTFIGNSTSSLIASDHLYTCDRDNDCVPSTPTRTCYPYRTSMQMFQDLGAKGVKADLVFLDGRLTPQDIDPLLRITHDQTVFAFDDYVQRQKGVVNVEALAPRMPQHIFVPPYGAFGGRSTLALLLPIQRP